MTSMTVAPTTGPMGHMTDYDRLVQDGGRDGRFTVTRAAYTEAELFEREMRLIFESGWVYLAHESQIANANDFITVRIGRKSVIVQRGADGGVLDLSLIHI